jgi:hypothetical protein
MKRTFFFLLAFTSFAIALPAAPTPTPGPKRTSNKTEKRSGPQETVAQSANGWSYFKGEWIHPEGYKFVNGKVLRTTARAGRLYPKPPGKLALENAQQLTPKTAPAAAPAQTEAERKAEERRKNLAPRPAPQTGTHM